MIASAVGEVDVIGLDVGPLLGYIGFDSLTVWFLHVEGFELDVDPSRASHPFCEAGCVLL